MFAIIFGTRPEYLKLKSLIDLFKAQNLIKYKIIFVSQHKDMQEKLSSDTLICPIEETKDERLNSLGIQILSNLPSLIQDCKYIIVQGDTSTAYFSSLCGFHSGKQIMHVEAGLRTYDLSRPYPEEAYRQMISRIATYNFSPHEDCSNILKEEKVSGSIITVGNPILDLIRSYNLQETKTNSVVITFHRRENWNKIDEFLIGVKRLALKTPEIIYNWYLHPNPDLQEKVKANISEFKSVILKNSLDHFSFTRELTMSKFIITDSGGIQEEASFIGKHIFVIRQSTERTHIPAEYLTVVQKYSELDRIYEENISKIQTHKLPCTVYGTGYAADQIFKIIQSFQD